MEKIVFRKEVRLRPLLHFCSKLAGGLLEFADGLTHRIWEHMVFFGRWILKTVVIQGYDQFGFSSDGWTWTGFSKDLVVSLWTWMVSLRITGLWTWTWTWILDGLPEILDLETSCFSNFGS